MDEICGASVDGECFDIHDYADADHDAGLDAGEDTGDDANGDTNDDTDDGGRGNRKPLLGGAGSIS